MKHIIFIISLGTVALLASGNTHQYSYKHGQNAYDQAKNGTMYQNRNGSREQSQQRQRKQLKDGSGGGQQHRYEKGSGGGRGKR